MCSIKETEKVQDALTEKGFECRIRTQRFMGICIEFYL